MDELNLFRRRRLPIVRSAEAAECGLSCITMIARYWGHDVDLTGLRQRFAVSMSGATLRSLMELADQLGFSTRSLRVDLSELGKVRLPAIAHWDLNHFVVLKAVDKKGVSIHDPGFGQRSISMGEVSRHFTGVILEVAPSAKFAVQKAKAPTKLSSLWSDQVGFPGAVSQVLGLSVALQIAVFAAPFYLQLVVDEAVLRADRELLAVLAIAFGALVLIQAAIEALRAWTLRYFGTLLSFQMVGNLTRHLLRLPVSFFEKRNLGDVLSRMGSTAPIQDAITRGIVAALVDGVMAVIAAFVLFFYSPLLTGVVIAGLILNLLVTLAAYAPMRRRMDEEIYASAKERTFLMESLRASKTIKLMGREAEREGAWRNHYADAMNASFSVGKYQIGLGFVQTFIGGIQTVLVVYLAARSILNGDGLSVGMLFAFLSFRQTFSDRAQSLINQTIQFRLLDLHLERLGDIVQTAPERSEAAAVPANFAGAICLRDVSFRYGASDALVLDGVDLTIEPGEYVGITGPSGGGKSTLLKLLLGIYPPTFGSMEIGGRTASVDLVRAWRAQAGIVAQDDALLSGTLADNIAFFDPDLDMKRVQAAAEAAQVHGEILSMPMQYLSLVGDMGSALSGGQRQRILLARALYRRPKVLLLDEGTANLDETMEGLISDLIAGMAITRIVVAHRPALLKRAHRVLVLDRGKLRLA